MAIHWQSKAACRDVDPELFFPVGEGPLVDQQVGRAKAICASCPVISLCLEAALSRQTFGVWGGTTEDERREIRAQRVALRDVPA